MPALNEVDNKPPKTVLRFRVSRLQLQMFLTTLAAIMKIKDSALLKMVDETLTRFLLNAPKEESHFDVMIEGVKNGE
jgi:hypothetical protein